ncbi:hypothetical protein M885DRAFT_466301 [Pelagophyceae sp. CCMP2097]|nr:hypothetical protein M885DRAFT_466301 [Pelagophyceae sp. CCMP2097]
MSLDAESRMRDLEDVAALSFQQDPAVTMKTEFPKIAGRALVKRASHDAAVKHFTAQLNGISDDVEAQVLAASRTLQAGLEAHDASIASIFAELNKDDVLVRHEHGYVAESWERIEGLLEHRNDAVNAFGARLEALEQLRAHRGGGELRTLVDALLATAHESPGQIERLVEAEAYELNSVIISNRRAHAELLAMLEHKDVDAGLRAIDAWRARQEAWRQLRHARAIAEFVAELGSVAFTNPSDRLELFRGIAEEQRAVDSKRLLLLDAVRASKCPRLDAAALAGYKQDFKDMYDGEDAAVSRNEAELQRLGQLRKGDAEMRREALRVELHTFSALEEEPDLFRHAAALEVAVADVDNEVLFRSSGGLKPELRELVGELRDPKLIYAHPLDYARQRLKVLLCGCSLRTILEKQGKANQQKAIHDTLERLRKAARHDVAPLLPLLQQQLAELADVAGLDDLFASEITDAVHDLRTITKDVDSRVAGRGSQASAKSGRSRQSARSKISKSQFGGTMSSAGRTDASGAGPEVNMMEVRAVQKRVAMHIHTCDLAPETVDELRRTVDSLDRQASCNGKIDEVVESECDGLLVSRADEGTELAMRVVAYLEKQASDMYDRASRVCDFYACVAKAIEMNVANEASADESMLDDLFDLKEKLREADEALEADVSASLHRLRHAAGVAELDESFDTVLDLLNSLEVKYREYHAGATAKALEHPDLDRAEALRFERAVCGMLGLATLDDAAPDAAPAPAPRSRGSRTERQFCVPGSSTTYSVETPLEQLVFALLEGSYDPLENGAPDELTQSLAETQSKPAEASFDNGDADDADDADEEPAAPFWRVGFEPLAAEAEAALSGAELEDYTDRRSAAFVVLTEDQIAELDEESGTAYDAAVQAVEARRLDVEAASKRAEKSAADVVAAPSDPEGGACVVALELGTAMVVDMVRELRESVIADTEKRSFKRQAHVAALTQERVKDQTEVLEERLRTHWPRKGRSEVKSRQPREGELISHRQRKERHMRLVMQRDSAQDGDFAKRLAECVSASDAFTKAVDKLKKSLGRATSLAGLQGAEAKLKKVVVAGDFLRHAGLAGLEAFCKAEPQKLVQLNEMMIKATRLFAEGGDYSEPEAVELREKLDGCTSTVLASAARRTAAVGDLRNRHAAALEHVSAFHATSEACLQELSLREGLGMKYGAPRRNAQEKLRTAQTRDEADATALDSLLGKLETDCSAVKAIVDRAANADPAKAAAPAETKRRVHIAGESPRDDAGQTFHILETLEAIRQRVYDRAKYLNFLPVPGALKRVLPLDDDADAPQRDAKAPDGKASPRTAAKDAVAAPSAPDDDAAQTIAQVVAAVDAVCRQETRELYAREGKEERLGESGVPESLQTWLLESEKKVLGDAGYRERAARRLRLQAQRLERLVAKAPAPPDPRVLGAPAALFADLLRRAQATAQRKREDAERPFGKRLAVWKAAREKHRAALRPQLGEPDAAGALQELCAAEAARRSDVAAAVDKVRAAVSGQLADHALEFTQSLLEAAKRCLLVLDHTVFTDDLGWLPGDEFLQQKRKSLKRLRKAARAHQAKAAAAGAGSGSDRDGGDEDDAVQPGLFGTGPGRQFETREWPGVDVSSVDAARDDGDVPAAPDGGSAALFAGDERLQRLAELARAPRLSCVTTAHRTLIRARDAALADFVGLYRAAVAGAEAHYGALLRDEDEWHAKWETLVKSLVRSES